MLVVKTERSKGQDLMMQKKTSKIIQIIGSSSRFYNLHGHALIFL